MPDAAARRRAAAAGLQPEEQEGEVGAQGEVHGADAGEHGGPVADMETAVRSWGPTGACRGRGV